MQRAGLPLFLILLLAMAVSPASFGQSPPDSAEIIIPSQAEAFAETRKHCGLQILTVCRNERKSLIPVRKCLYEKRASIDGTCAEHIKDYSKKFLNYFKLKCGEDVKKFCSTVPAGGNRVSACLKSASGVSGDCKKMINATAGN